MGRLRLTALCLLLAGCASAQTATTPAPPSAVMVQTAQAQAASRGMLAGGYLARTALPDSLLINPPPPAPGSGAMARDEAGAMAAIAMQGSPRFDQARIDADLFTPTATSVFSCAAGFEISAAATPKLNALLRRIGPDLALAVYPSKNLYKRKRPFMVNGKPTCTPDHQPMLEKDGSYPSGHSAIGYGMGLVLAEVVPARASQLVARGISFGDSRRVCNVHWLSDVEEGRAVAAAVVARLHAEAAFRADLDAVRAEVAAVGPATQPDCARENAALVVRF